MMITSSDSKSTPLAVWLWDIRLLDVVPDHLRKKEKPRTMNENIAQAFNSMVTTEYKKYAALNFLICQMGKYLFFKELGATLTEH